MLNDSDKVADGLVNSLSKVLERRRQELRMSQEDLSKKAGLSRTYLSDIERGLRNISVVTLHKLAEALSTQASVMLAHAEQLESSLSTAAEAQPATSNMSSHS
jgi:transcriptional regulator with XRE-family HTH domain